MLPYARHRHMRAGYGLSGPPISSAWVCSVTFSCPLGMDTRDCRVPWLECSGPWQRWGLFLRGSPSTVENLTLFWGHWRATCPSTAKKTASSESLVYVPRVELRDQGRQGPTFQNQEEPSQKVKQHSHTPTHHLTAGGRPLLEKNKRPLGPSSILRFPPQECISLSI